jgi:hypothetical protein
MFQFLPAFLMLFLHSQGQAGTAFRALSVDQVYSPILPPISLVGEDGDGLVHQGHLLAQSFFQLLDALDSSQEAVPTRPAEGQPSSAFRIGAPSTQQQLATLCSCRKLRDGPV